MRFYDIHTVSVSLSFVVKPSVTYCLRNLAANLIFGATSVCENTSPLVPAGAGDFMVLG
jgi:hypothetical protein